MADDTANADPLLEDQLVAYLDGELDADSARRIEQLLAENPKVRDTLRHLDQTWRMLDDLEPSQVDVDFTKSTLEMVAVAASDEVAADDVSAPRAKRRRWIGTLAVLVAAALAGFAAVGMLLPDPNSELIRDLPVVENLDTYRAVGDYEFLELLRREGLFAKDRQPTDKVLLDESPRDIRPGNDESQDKNSPRGKEPDHAP